MTGPSGNRLSICPLRFSIASPRVSMDLGCASFNRNSWEGDPESLRANRSVNYPRDQSLFVIYIYIYIYIYMAKPVWYHVLALSILYISIR